MGHVFHRKKQMIKTAHSVGMVHSIRTKLIFIMIFLMGVALFLFWVMNRMLFMAFYENSKVELLENSYAKANYLIKEDTSFDVERRILSSDSQLQLEILSENRDIRLYIFDISNMGQINREYGHSKGDEVIKIVASKINENIKKQDIAARYGGDKIAIIMPDTTADEAKYVCEFLFYNLSCTMFDDLGQLKF